MSGPAAPVERRQVAARTETQLRNFLTVLLEWHDNPDLHDPVSRAGRDLLVAIDTAQQAGLVDLASGLRALFRLFENMGDDPRGSNHGLQMLLRSVGEVRVEAASIVHTEAPAASAEIAVEPPSARGEDPPAPVPDQPTTTPANVFTIDSLRATREAARNGESNHPTSYSGDPAPSEEAAGSGEVLPLSAFSEVADLLQRLSQALGVAVVELRAALGLDPPLGEESTDPAATVQIGLGRSGDHPAEQAASDEGTSVVCMLVDAGSQRFAIPFRAIRAALSWDPSRGRSIEVATNELEVEPLGGTTFGRPRHPVIVARDNEELHAYGADWLLGMRKLDLDELLRPAGPIDSDGTPLTVLCAWALSPGSDG